ncbi:uncharacterized protein BDV17DRAFT_49002 [Aspergillus undulatus]|uniref:uncharacterized protein n=1 Tax=Aspergillus undulatus TaxID=1810928 RepID=UPI003CCCD061
MYSSSSRTASAHSPLPSHHNPNVRRPTMQCLSTRSSAPLLSPSSISSSYSRKSDPWTGQKNVGLHFGPIGLSHFESLRSLHLPDSFLTEVNGFDPSGKTAWIPHLLTTICLTNARLKEYLCPSRIDAGTDTDRNPGKENQRQTKHKPLITFDFKTTSNLLYLPNLLPNLKMIVIRSENCEYVTGSLGIRAGIQPGAVTVTGESLRPFVDRGIRVGIEIEEWLGRCWMLGLRLGFRYRSISTPCIFYGSGPKRPPR